MYLEAVTVCVNYGDFLRAIAPLNAPLFDRWIVVTEAADDETRAICAKYGLVCLVSEEHRRPVNPYDGGKFNKGALVDRGLQLCSRHAWRLHLDADIVLPAQFRRLLDMASLDPSCLYGADRINVPGWDNWQALLRSGWLHGATDTAHLNCVEFPRGLPVGARWASYRAGYVPLGFFQLWHSSQDEDGWRTTKTYPRTLGDACHSDTQHAFQWDRKKRILLPEVIAVHLDSEFLHTGANWNGRKTKRFGPEVAGDLRRPVS